MKGYAKDPLLNRSFPESPDVDGAIHLGVSGVVGCDGGRGYEWLRELERESLGLWDPLLGREVRTMWVWEW